MPPFVKNEGSPPNIGGRGGGPGGAGGGGGRGAGGGVAVVVQRVAELVERTVAVVRPVGREEAVYVRDVQDVVVARQLCRPAVVAAGVLVVGSRRAGEDERLLGARPAVAVAVEGVAADGQRFVDGGVAVVIDVVEGAVEALRAAGRAHGVPAGRPLVRVEDQVVVVVSIQRAHNGIDNKTVSTVGLEHVLG